MEHKPSEQMLTKIYAFSLRYIETHFPAHISHLLRRIRSRYGVTMTKKELLKLLNREQDDNPFIYWR